MDVQARTELNWCRIISNKNSVCLATQQQRKSRVSSIRNIGGVEKGRWRDEYAYQRDESWCETHLC